MENCRRYLLSYTFLCDSQGGSENYDGVRQEYYSKLGVWIILLYLSAAIHRNEVYFKMKKDEIEYGITDYDCFFIEKNLFIFQSLYVYLFTIISHLPETWLYLSRKEGGVGGWRYKWGLERYWTSI